MIFEAGYDYLTSASHLSILHQIAQGLAAESIPIGPGRDAAWLEGVSNFNQAYIHQGLYQVFFVNGISIEWDSVADSHEMVWGVWAFTKR